MIHPETTDIGGKTYRPDSTGRMVPVDTIRPVDATRDNLVLDIVARAKALAETLASFREKALGEITAFVELSHEQYGVKRGRGRGGNVTLNSFDGQYRIVVESDDRVTFNEQLDAAKALIWKCIDRWTEGSNKEIRAVVDAAFKASRGGTISVTKVLALKQVKIDDAEWLRAMDALTDALQVVGSATYLRIYERVDGDKYRKLSLDVFPAAGAEGGAK